MDVGDVSPDSDRSIEERLRVVCGHLNVLNARLVELAAEAVATGAWEGWGVRSLEHWLTWQAGISPARANEVARLASARESHPLVMATFAEGALSVDQAAIATKAPGYLGDWFRRGRPVRHRRPVANDGPRRVHPAALADPTRRAATDRAAVGLVR